MLARKVAGGLRLSGCKSIRGTEGTGRCLRGTGEDNKIK